VRKLEKHQVQNAQHYVADGPTMMVSTQFIQQPAPGFPPMIGSHRSGSLLRHCFRRLATLFSLLIPLVLGQDLMCQVVTYEPEILRDPCHVEMKQKAPQSFSIEFDTNYQGSFICNCERQRAPVHADRIWNLARFGYYSDNYFFRVLPNFVAQFGTSGDPLVSKIYNYSTTTIPECAILHPQPPYMPYCLAEETDNLKKRGLAWIARSQQTYQSLLPWTSKQRRPAKTDCTNTTGLSNAFGTLSMSTSYNKNVSEYPQGVTWNATAELFINFADNRRLDKHLFIPICTIENMDMVLKFPSFGEVAELGGPGPSLGMLYEQGNSYIESNEEWASSMAKVDRVRVCDTSNSS
jgi:cyclophilin family peptidyl-prolyl cis-trans isomerase